MHIDTHVHFRDEEQENKETIKHGLEVARDSGVVAVFDMPNTKRPVITRERVLDRLKLAKDANVPEVFYGLYIGLTADSEQIKQAVQVYREFKEVVGMKLYAGHSVGDLGVVDFEAQRTVYKTLSNEGYDGVLVVHCEKEDEINRGNFDPLRAMTHCFAQPEEAEIESVRDQIKLAYETNFMGKLHIAHISSPKAVELVVEAKKQEMDISSEICPHHFIYDWRRMNSKEGLLWKMNPPLRSPESRDQMLQYLHKGEIDWIATDHAPHSLDEKMKEPFMSGIPGIAWWPIFEEFLRRHDFSDNEIERLTFSNAVERFSIDVPTKKPRKLKDSRGDYPFNPYEPMEKELKWSNARR